MSDREFTLALNVCQAYRSKSINFRGEYLDKNFRFLLQEKNCEGEVRKYSLDTRFDGQGFQSSHPVPYIREFETHTQGHLGRICSHIMQGERGPAGFLDRESEATQITFTPQDSSEHYRVRIGERKILSFQVNLDPASPMLGANTRTTLWEVCEQSGWPPDYSELIQLLQVPD